MCLSVVQLQACLATRLDAIDKSRKRSSRRIVRVPAGEQTGNDLTFAEFEADVAVIHTEHRARM
jgi:hypothetical protein